MRRAGVLALVLVTLLSILVQGGEAREHILLSVDYGRATVIEQARKNVVDVVSEMKQGNLDRATHHFTGFGNLVTELGQGFSRQTPDIRVEAMEVLGVMLLDLQNALVLDARFWHSDQRMHDFVFAELTKIGNAASPIVLMGLQDSDEQVQLRSFLTTGVLVGGRADFQSLSLGADYQELSMLSSGMLDQVHQQFVLLKEYDKSSPKLAKWIEVLSAISDKVHDMIEAAI